MAQSVAPASVASGFYSKNSVQKTFPQQVFPPQWRYTNFQPTTGNTSLSSSQTTYVSPASAGANIVSLTGMYAPVYNVASDIRLKENIQELDLTLCENLMKLQPKQYNYKFKPNDEKIHYGFIAQELEKHFPNLVTENPSENSDENIKYVNYLELIPVLLLKIQDLQNQINNLSILTTIYENDSNDDNKLIEEALSSNLKFTIENT
jgi:hypothetical protein